MKKVIFIFSLLFSIHLTANECTSASTRIVFDRKTEVENIILCTKKTNDKMLFYMSQSCINNNCEILKHSPSPIKIKNYHSNLGSPGFKLCEALGGVPQIFEFKILDHKWQSSERCLFGLNDFVEISYLTKLWKQFI